MTATAVLRLLARARRLSPTPARLLVRQQPVGPGQHRGIIGVGAHGRQSVEGLERSVDVPHAPAALPTPVGQLGTAEIRYGPIDGDLAVTGIPHA